MRRNSLKEAGHNARVMSTEYGAPDASPAAKHGNVAMHAETFWAKATLSNSLSTHCQNPPLKRDTANIPNRRKKMTQTHTKMPNAGNAPSRVSTTNLRFGLRLIRRSGRSARRIRIVFTAAKIDPEAVPRYAAATSITDTNTTTKSSWFQGLRMYAHKPTATILIIISKKKIVVNTRLLVYSTHANVEVGSESGLSKTIATLLIKMQSIMVGSNARCATTRWATRRPPLTDPVCTQMTVFRVAFTGATTCDGT
mmetsp:Transcript_22948/g.58833  ORF Transcript_22948/g.58833 Transcript_22948/m.58833 type:complete len:253 (+) Transcript_22948:2117-2875(+)